MEEIYTFILIIRAEKEKDKNIHCSIIKVANLNAID